MDLKIINKEVKKLFKGNKNLKSSEVLGDFISLEFTDVNNSPENSSDLHTFIYEGLLKSGIDLKSEGLTVCYCDGDYMSIQEPVIPNN